MNVRSFPGTEKRRCIGGTLVTSTVCLLYGLNFALAEAPERDGELSGLPTSFIQLVAVPEKFEGQTIFVVGYLHRERNGGVLMLTEADEYVYRPENSIWLDLSGMIEVDRTQTEEWHGRLVFVKGTVSLKKGYRGMFALQLDEVSMRVLKPKSP